MYLVSLIDISYGSGLFLVCQVRWIEFPVGMECFSVPGEMDRHFPVGMEHF